MRVRPTVCSRRPAPPAPRCPPVPSPRRSLLAYNHLSVDGTALEGTGFKYAVPGGVTADLLRDAVAQHIAAGIFPPIL